MILAFKNIMDKMIEFTIYGQVRGGKNNILISRTGHRYPVASWARWRDQVVRDLRFYLNQLNHKIITYDCAVKFYYYAGEKKTRDIPSMIDALFHCFEKANLVENDKQFKELVWFDCGLSQDPRVDVKIREL